VVAHHRGGGRAGPVAELRALGEGGGDPGVQPGPLAGQQVGVDRLLGERVPEAVGVAGVGLQHAVGGQLAQGREQRVLRQLGDVASSG
jgi:hypothetical protein